MNLTAELEKIKNPHPSPLYCCLLFQLCQKATCKKSKSHPKIINKQNPRNTTCFGGSLLFARQQETVVCLNLAKVYTAKTPQQLCSNPSHVIKDCRIQALNRFYYLESTELKSKLQAATLLHSLSTGASFLSVPSLLLATVSRAPHPLSLPCGFRLRMSHPQQCLQTRFPSRAAEPRGSTENRSARLDPPFLSTGAERKPALSLIWYVFLSNCSVGSSSVSVMVTVARVTFPSRA